MMEWKDPPLDHWNMNGPWLDIAAELKARPNEWALIIHYDDLGRAANLASTIRHGHNNAWRPRLTFEARSRQGDVYARYIGEQK
jgi:hypothetical protein